MIKIILVDDESLVLIGLQGMINWEEHGYKIVGTANNGLQAIELIDSLHPDIIITDIKMPQKTGIDLVRHYHSLRKTLPLFIILTSFEEFNYAKQALQYGACDYLVKLELDQPTLLETLNKAKNRLIKIGSVDSNPNPPEHDLTSFRDKFFIRLYSNLFETPQAFEIQKENLQLDFSASAYTVAYCKITSNLENDINNRFQLYTSSVKIIENTISKYLPCYITSLDLQYLSICFCSDDIDTIQTALQQSCSMVNSYFKVSLLCSVGSSVTYPLMLHTSYRQAKNNFSKLTSQSPIQILHATDTPITVDTFDLKKYTAQLATAFEEFNDVLLYEALTNIVADFKNQVDFTTVLDSTCELLYMSITLIPDGEAILHRIFSDAPNSFRSIYKCKTTAECCDKLIQLRDGLQIEFQSSHKNHKQKLIKDVESYILNNLDKKLSLQEVSAIFNFSSNYLSQLFAQFGSYNYVEFVTRARIEKAQTMLLYENKKIYEVADSLGFENAFYFSKVFKKTIGVSPREFLKTHQK